MNNIVMLSAAKPDKLLIQDIQLVDGVRYVTHTYKPKNKVNDRETILADKTGQIFIYNSVFTLNHISTVHYNLCIYAVQMTNEGLEVVHYNDARENFNRTCISEEILADNESWTPLAAFERASQPYWTIEKRGLFRRKHQVVRPEFRLVDPEILHVVDSKS